MCVNYKDYILVEQGVNLQWISAYSIFKQKQIMPMIYLFNATMKHVI